jgi:CHAT domain-containing protein
VYRNSESPTRDIFIGAGGERYPELPATEKELHAIINLFKSSNQEALGYFHEKATEDIIKSEDMANYNFIHIATHSLKDSRNTKLSGLIFSKPASAADAEDGILYSSEIYNLNLNAKLVVLSSCESGIGILVKGEGMFALARGFFYSGVQNIIFSLWKVEDKTTSRLMIELYRNILSGQGLPDALRKAKLELIKNRFTAFPKYWSGFILVGE